MRPVGRLTSPLVAATLMTRAGRVTSALVAATLVTTLALGPARAQQPDSAKTLDDLLDTIKRSTSGEDAALKRREAAFRANRDQRNAMLKAAEKRLADAQRRGAELERRFDDNKTRLDNLEKTLKTRLGTMAELFGVIRQVAGDTRAQVDGSFVSAQYPGRGDSLEKLATSKAMPAMKQLEHLWWVLQHEMTESGKVVRFSAPVIGKSGRHATRKVVRVGPFNAVGDGKFLRWNKEAGKLESLGRQPPLRYRETAARLENARTGVAGFAVDPSRGQLLSMLVQTPTLKERVGHGGVIGYAIIVMGALALLLGLFRLAQLGLTSLAVRRQRGPLRRIIQVYEQNASAGVEVLERKLDEQILEASSRLDRFLWAFKIVAVVAPLMGLLGTVTGMLRTFQAITLYGTGDPKLMAGGISEALVPTMLGLCVAIPIVLLHSWLKSISGRVSDVLEKQSAGFIAQRVEAG